MTKYELNAKTDTVIATTREALQMVLDGLNQGQQKKLLKNETIAALFERYGVEVSG